MADSVAPESIPDSDALYKWIHPLHYVDEHILSAAFTNTQMSVNWAKRSTAEQTARSDSPLVVSLIAGFCRGLGQTVEHKPLGSDDPSGPNLAHAEVIGKKTGATKTKLRDSAVVAWRRPPATS